MPERDRLGQRFVEREGAGQRAGDLRDVEGVRQAGDVVVALRIEEDLRLVLEAPEGLGVDDPIAIPLEGGSERIRLLRANSSSALS